ncbi:hypothetical protein DL96DRAFT_1617492 [Flagelloscypha sp. PMI_526]|nr:hypothetical protein DL96DRAFT_1617492 [Flagelloscypha sp. PMI_526]
MLSNLTHLGTNSLFLEDISMVNWTSEFWSVTHLKRGSIHSTPQSHRHLLKSFPKVTHFVTKLICSPSEFFQDASALATELFYLEVLVVVYEPITRDVESFAESFPNLVIRGVNELFGDGIEARFKEIALDEGGDTWSSAEEEIERRKQSTKLQT